MEKIEMMIKKEELKAKFAQIPSDRLEEAQRVQKMMENIPTKVGKGT
jgi:hypothetical protein